jgi:hypothetical protein
MAEIRKRRLSYLPGDFDYRVWWIDNANVERERFFATHRVAVQFVIETESALLREAVDMLNAALASVSATTNPSRFYRV